MKIGEGKPCEFSDVSTPKISKTDEEQCIPGVDCRPSSFDEGQYKEVDMQKMYRELSNMTSWQFHSLSLSWKLVSTNPPLELNVYDVQPVKTPKK